MHPLVKIPVMKDSIPAWLTAKHQWVCWVVRNSKPNGKFSKVPVDPVTGKAIDGTKPEFWLSFDEACRYYEAGLADGIGIALSKEPFDRDEYGNRYLVALDFDNCAEKSNEIKEIWKALGKPYTEISPSGKGIRMFTFSRESLKGGNDGIGHEMYTCNRFMTVTGSVIGGCNV